MPMTRPNRVAAVLSPFAISSSALSADRGSRHPHTGGLVGCRGLPSSSCVYWAWVMALKGFLEDFRVLGVAEAARQLLDLVGELRAVFPPVNRAVQRFVVARPLSQFGVLEEARVVAEQRVGWARGGEG